MAVNIFQIPKKETVNRSMQSKSIMVVGKSKSGKSTLCSEAPRPVFLMTENGVEALTGMVPVPIASWTDFKQYVNQLCTPQGRENFDTVVIDTYTNLILLLDKYIGGKMSTESKSLDFGSDAEYGKGAKAMRNELGIQLQKLANQGFILLNIVHAEDKVDFDTGKSYIGTSLSNSLYGVAEKFVDQIIYLRADEDRKTKEIKHNIWFNSKGGFAGTGGRFTPKEDFVHCSYKNLEEAILGAVDNLSATKGIKTVVSDGPAVKIDIAEETLDFESIKSEFNALTAKLMEQDSSNADKIRSTVESVLGAGKTASKLTPAQVELMAEILTNLKATFNITE